MVLGTTHKRHMIPAPPAVSSAPDPQETAVSMGHLNSTMLSATIVPQVVPPLYPKYGVIHRNSFKTLGRYCIHFHSIPQTANAGVCRLPGSNGMERNEAFIVHLKCAHVYAAIFPSLYDPFITVPYLTIYPPPLPLIQCGALIVGANLIAFKGSGMNFSL
ncbi:hypothetical protein XELAEV_18022968mg [Xenopus laevis]|uniref:Uncharacterized protein n=1 Tax=Xenopus laevis TaxID=8355 RepID=A0A974HP88_XENLA|nr:hypothetical protein XELAEV_18022968mg [Xenopus laevis]